MAYSDYLQLWLKGSPLFMHYMKDACILSLPLSHSYTEEINHIKLTPKGPCQLQKESLISHDLGIVRRKHRNENLKDCYSKCVLNLLIGIKVFWPGGTLEGDQSAWWRGLGARYCGIAGRAERSAWEPAVTQAVKTAETLLCQQRSI